MGESEKVGEREREKERVCVWICECVGFRVDVEVGVNKILPWSTVPSE